MPALLAALDAADVATRPASPPLPASSAPPALVARQSAARWRRFFAALGVEYAADDYGGLG